MIDTLVIKKEVLHRGRWHVVFDKPYNGSRRMLKAHYVWLKGNPAFEKIPKGYVIHHLDNDPLNDDISNLALMQKHHHTAYHWKHRTVSPDIEIEQPINGLVRQHCFPTKKPTIMLRKDTGRYVVNFYEKLPGSSKGKSIRLYKYRGERIVTKKDAERIAGEIWAESNR